MVCLQVPKIGLRLSNMYHKVYREQTRFVVSKCFVSAGPSCGNTFLLTVLSDQCNPEQKFKEKQHNSCETEHLASLDAAWLRITVAHCATCLKRAPAHLRLHSALLPLMLSLLLGMKAEAVVDNGTPLSAAAVNVLASG